MGIEGQIFFEKFMIKSHYFFTLLVCIQVLTHVNTNAQNQIVLDPVTGKPLTDLKYENVTGSPYLVDQWLNGEVRLANGSLVKSKAVKYDAVENKLLFQQDNKVFEFFPKAVAFVLFAPERKRTFLLKENEKDGYFELLEDGKIQLLKKTRKKIVDRKDYNSSVVETIIAENVSYFLLVEGKQKEVKLNRKSIISVLPSYKEYINTQNLDPSDLEKSFIKLIAILNTK
ncbi:hypothetical protein [Pedobacter sp. SL55]|uniref:hypothetical protein n=1 Tax=Pedobacter sp. SL55 TaxID=2995161 RepID=UPI0022700668|nr:hypothetical protein [Pedobacter sp. SL55]WAC41889.1 hypothetical protein OVA16_05885 [Pedobacter sp. SL55]